VLAVVIALGVACTVGGFSAFFALIAIEGPARASFITYIAPIVAIGAGSLVRAEPVTVRTVLGTALVLLGAALAARRPTA
jgi:drug/metabolite transporter (DMT)-like permease